MILHIFLNAAQNNAEIKEIHRTVGIFQNSS